MFEEISPVESVSNAQNLATERAENVIALGQLLGSQKIHKLFSWRGCRSFKEFVESEYGISSGEANKWISLYNLYITDLDMDEQRFKDIGIDKLGMIKPFVIKAEKYSDKEEWITEAENSSMQDLRDYIKEVREAEKKAKKTLKDVYIEQHFMKMTELFNCGRKELDFKMALYFQSKDMGVVKEEVRDQQLMWEESVLRAEQVVNPATGEVKE